MWRKIHSNRDPRDTLFSELHKEFKSYFSVAESAGKRMVSAYPKLIFWSMVILMTSSATLSFTVFRHHEKAIVKVVGNNEPVEDGFNQILQTTGDIRETMKLKKLVDSLSAKKQLAPSDSALLDSALDKLSRIHQKLK